MAEEERLCQSKGIAAKAEDEERAENSRQRSRQKALALCH